jgi:hypothetical protein
MMPYGLQPPAKLLIPDYRPFRTLSSAPRRRQLADPVPAGHVRVVLCDDYYLGMTWRRTADGERVAAGDACDVPAGQFARWEAAEAAYHAVQDEAWALVRDPATT